jgi:putative sigma-54 modulation protein
MKIEFTGRQTDVPKRVRALAERKLAKLARVLRGITYVHVVLSSDKHRQIAEVTVHSRNLDLTAEESSDDLGVSVAAVFDKLTRQAQRQVGKRRESKRRGPGLGARAGDGAAAPERSPTRIIRSRRFPVKPMTVDEAALEVGARDEGFLVFRDASTEKVSVLYRRKDGNLGLIEPEA